MAEALHCDLETWDGKACEYSVRSLSSMNEHKVWSRRHGGCGASVQCRFCPAFNGHGEATYAYTSNNGFNKHKRSDRCWGNRKNPNYTGMPHPNHSHTAAMAGVAQPMPPPTASAPGET